MRVLDNLSTGRKSNLEHLAGKIEFIEGDITDAAAVAEAVRGVDCVFHQAALASVPRSVERPLDTHAACVTGTLTVLDAARRAGVRRLVYAGSSSAYGDQPTSPKRETDLPAPISPYGAAKLAGEAYCQAFWGTYGFETVAIRYFNVFGPRQDPNSQYSAVIPLFITAMLAGRQPTVYGDGGNRAISLTSTTWCTATCWRPTPTAELVAGRMFNVANGRSTSLLELVSMLNRPAGHARRAGPRRGPRGRRARKPGRHHPGPAVARLRAAGRFRRRAAPLDRVLQGPGGRGRRARNSSRKRSVNMAPGLSRFWATKPT